MEYLIRLWIFYIQCSLALTPIPNEWYELIVAESSCCNGAPKQPKPVKEKKAKKEKKPKKGEPGTSEQKDKDAKPAGKEVAKGGKPSPFQVSFTTNKPPFALHYYLMLYLFIYPWVLFLFLLIH